MQVHDYAGASSLVNQALGIDPGNARGLAFGAVLAANAGQKDPALKLMNRALKLAPANPVVIDSAAAVFNRWGQPHRARELWERLIELSPHSAKTFWNLAMYHSAQNDVSAAEICYRKAIELKPDVVGGYMNLGNVVKRSGRIEEAVSLYREGARRHPEDIRQTGNYLLALNYDPSYGPEQIYAENAAWGKAVESAVAGRSAHSNERSPDRRLRVGYVSPDLRDHAVGHYFMPLFRQHDHSQFEIYCYSDVRQPDEMTDRFRQGTDVWRESGLSDAELAAQVSEDRIDVLVDLVMHMEGSRFGFFARKPAPVQVTWMAYPGTTGLTRMDYRFTDPVLDPPGETDHFYTEQSIRLDTFWCFEPPANSPGVGPLPVEKNGHFTFGCLNNFAKVNGTVLGLWREILAAVPDSRLILMPPKGKTKDRVLEKLQLAPDRLVCLPKAPRKEYLDYYNRIDLALDPFPYTGHTTTLDGLWMGVPLVSWPVPPLPHAAA